MSFKKRNLSPDDLRNYITDDHNEGGGATVAKFLSAKGLDVLNAGPAMLAMHSPFEITAKKDILETLKAYTAYLA